MSLVRSTIKEPAFSVNSLPRCPPDMKIVFLIFPLLTLAGPRYADPQLTSLFPLSCQCGKDVEVTLAGKEVKNASELLFSVPGISAEAVGNGKFLVRVDETAQARNCDVYCVVGGRLSNPRRFVISSQSCVVEQSGNDTPETAQEIPLPGAVDGRLEAATKYDWYQFEGRSGLNVILICRSRTLDGSVEPIVSLFGPGGRELAHSSGRQREPVMTLTLPENGRYRIRISDKSYRKNDQSFYRLEVLTGPRVFGCFPNVLQKDETRDVTLFGFGLAEPHSGQQAGNQTALTGMPLRISGNNIPSRLAWQESVLPFPSVSLDLPDGVNGFANVMSVDVPVTVEQETHTESMDVFQMLNRPVLLNGRFDRSGDVDWFGFSSQKNESIRIDIFGDRLGQRMDLDAAILDAKGKILVTFKESGLPKGYPSVLSAESKDVSAVWKASADGEYRLVVRDLYGNSIAGAGRTYVLHLRTNRPSFRVFALPPNESISASATIPKAGYSIWRLFVARQDGFDGAIRITLDEGSKLSGVSLDECWIGPAETSANALLTSTDNAGSGGRLLSFQAEAKIGDDLIQSPVAVITPLANNTVPGRVVDRVAVLVSTEEPLRVRLKNPTPKIKAGQKLKLVVSRSHLAGTLKSAAKIEFPVLPAGIKIAKASLNPNDEKTTVELTIPEKLKPGRYSLAALVTATVLQKLKQDAKPKELTVRIWSNSITFEVLLTK
jgi:hypothetical protein